MPWDEKTFGNIAADVEIKELVQALIPTKLSAAEMGTEESHSRPRVLLS
jgi:hypothetical protein